MGASTELIVALDVNTLHDAEMLVRELGDTVEWYKIGKQLFTRHGPQSLALLKQMGKRVFLDLKFHDIPNTVAQAVRSAAAIGADMTNVHASGGPVMLQAAAQAGIESGILVVAVTVLTSLDADELAATGIPDTPEQQVRRLAALSQANGIAGVVCSGQEISPLREQCGTDFLLVVPGIRPAGSTDDDQKRIMTPAQAAQAGADYIVVGRPVRNAEYPQKAAKGIQAELASAAT